MKSPTDRPSGVPPGDDRGAEPFRRVKHRLPPGRRINVEVCAVCGGGQPKVALERRGEVLGRSVAQLLGNRRDAPVRAGQQDFGGGQACFRALLLKRLAVALAQQTLGLPRAKAEPLRPAGRASARIFVQKRLLDHKCARLLRGVAAERVRGSSPPLSRSAQSTSCASSVLTHAA